MTTQHVEVSSQLLEVLLDLQHVVRLRRVALHESWKKKEDRKSDERRSFLAFKYDQLIKQLEELLLKENIEMEKIDTKDKKWQAGPRTVAGIQVRIAISEESRIVRPDTVANKDPVAIRLTSVGPDVKGYNEGDVIAYRTAQQLGPVVFVRVEDIMGRLVSGDAPSSAVGVTPDGVPLQRAGAELTTADVERMVNAD